MARLEMVAKEEEVETLGFSAARLASKEAEPPLHNLQGREGEEGLANPPSHPSPSAPWPPAELGCETEPPAPCGYEYEALRFALRLRYNIRIR